MIISALKLGPGMDHYVAIGAGDISGEQSLAQLNGARSPTVKEGSRSVDAAYMDLSPP